MARTVAEIQQSIIDQKNLQADLNPLDSPSKTAIWLLWTFIVAVCIALHEQLWDIFKVELEDIALKSVPATANWWQDQILKFQYSATTPQVIGLVAFYPTYPIINTDMKIITRCSIGETNTLTVAIKVAKGVFPAVSALDSGELSALTSYVDKIKPAGIQTDITSLDADRIRIQASIFYNGQFVANSVKSDVIIAINSFLAAIPFNSIVYTSQLLNVIHSVNGVIDASLVSVSARANATPILLASPIARFYETRAGYIIPEDTALNTLDDTISMTLSNI